MRTRRWRTIVLGTVLVSAACSSAAAVDPLVSVTEDAPLPLLALDPEPAHLDFVVALDSRNEPIDPEPDHLIVLRSTTGRLVSVSVTISPRRRRDPVFADGATSDTTVHGFPALLAKDDADYAQLVWTDDALTYDLIIRGAGGAVAVAAADGLERTGPHPRDVVVRHLPEGFAVRFEGAREDLRSPNGYLLDYHLDHGRRLVVDVARGGLPASDVAALGGYERTVVRGRPGFVGPGTPLDPLPDLGISTIVIDLGGGVVLTLYGHDLSRVEVLLLARSLRVVDETAFRRLMDATPGNSRSPGDADREATTVATTG